MVKASGIENPLADTLARLSGLLSTLYRLTETTPAADFQEAALAAASEVIGFDSAFWGSGVVTPDGPVVHTMHLYRQPVEMMQSWERVKHLDELNAAVVRRLGTTVVAHADGFDADHRFAPEGRAHCHRFGMEHMMSTVFPDPVSGLFSAISFYRADPLAPFREEDRLLKQHLMPHMADAWSSSRLKAVERQALPARADRKPLALCDRFGLLHVSNPEFVALMQTEWPGWRGPMVPAELWNKRSRQLVGQRIVAGAAPFTDMWWIYAREKRAVDELSRRELEVARLFGKGQGHQEIAQALHVSPSTVRNHLKNAYAKLGVSNKVALAELLRW